MADRVTRNAAHLLHWSAPDRATGLFVQAKVYDSGWASAIATVNLTDKGGGNYIGSYTPTSSGDQIVDYTPYTDSGHTIIATIYGTAQDRLDVQASDVDAVKTDTAAIKAKTDNLPAAPASTSDVTSARDSIKGSGGPLVSNDIAELGRVELNRRREVRGTAPVERIYNDGETTGVRYERPLRGSDGTDGAPGSPSIGNLPTSEVHEIGEPV